MALMSFFIYLHHFGEAPSFEWAIKSKHEGALLLDAKNVWRKVIVQFSKFSCT